LGVFLASKSSGSRRNADSHNAIIEATAELLATDGYVNFTIENVAAKAGVGKQTIYRWWGSKAELVLEVLRDRLLPEVL
jgi:AcrR family transcriptional regulator